MKRRIISFAPIGLTKMYLDKIETDLAGEIRADRENIQAVGTTSIFNRMISGYFLLRYGKEERQIIRNKFNEDIINDIEGGINNMDIKYRKESLDEKES